MCFIAILTGGVIFIHILYNISLNCKYFLSLLCPFGLFLFNCMLNFIHYINYYHLFRVAGGGGRERELLNGFKWAGPIKAHAERGERRSKWWMESANDKSINGAKQCKSLANFYNRKLEYTFWHWTEELRTK